MDRNALSDRVHEGIIVCSDRRLRPTLDRLYNNGRRVIVSTGGANVSSVGGTVRDLTARGVKRWTVLAHTDTTDLAKGCRWVGQAAAEVQAKLAGTKLPQRYVDPAQVDRFIQHGYTTRELIEEHNLVFQTEALRALLVGTGAHVDNGATLDTSTMFADDALPQVLVVTAPSALKYSSMAMALNADGGNRVGSYNTFYSQVSHFSEAVVDARVFTGPLQVKDVRLLYLTKSDHHRMARWKSSLESERFMKGVSLTEAELNTAATTRYGRRARA
jgi:hypothetical protein